MGEWGVRARVMGAVATVVVGLAAMNISCAPEDPYTVALFGDVPYTKAAEAGYDRLITAVNAADVAFSTHVGDFKSGGAPCTTPQVTANRARFDRFERPLVYTPGDNEWTDCDAPTARLATLRDLVYRGTGVTSRGRTTMSLASQDSQGYPENARWEKGPVTFVTLHVVGSEDGVANGSEQLARRNADVAWLRQAFDSARDRRDGGIVVLGHAALSFAAAEGQRGVYESLFKALRDETRTFDGQVLYVHGDGHEYVNDRPMTTTSGTTVANFRRLQVYGNPAVRWIRLTVDPGSPGLFAISVPAAP